MEYRPFADPASDAAAAEKSVPYWYTTDMHRCAPHLLPFELDGTRPSAAATPATQAAPDASQHYRVLCPCLVRDAAGELVIKRRHPHRKPRRLMQYLVETYTEPGTAAAGGDASQRSDGTESARARVAGD